MTTAERPVFGAGKRGASVGDTEYAALLDALDDGACVFERLPPRPDGLRDYRYVAMNAAMRKMFGIADLSGQSIRDNFPDEVEDWYDDYDRVLDTGEPVRILRRSDPQDMAIEMCVTQMGQDGPLLAVMRDVTERVRTENALLESEAEARGQAAEIEMIYATAQIGLCVLDRDLRYRRINDRLAEMNGVAAADHIGRAVREVLPDIADEIEGIARRILETGEPVHDHELSGETASQPGVTRHWIEQWLPLRDDSGEICAIRIAVEEVTDRKRSERQRTEELAAMSRLHKIHTMSVRESSLDAVLKEVIDAAIAIVGGDFGNIQLYDALSGTLRIAAQRGFDDRWLDYWKTVGEGDGTCGTVLKHTQRVLVEDVEKSDLFVGTPALDVQRKAGVRAVQSTPLTTRDGWLVGVFSTHYRQPHQWDDRGLRLLDLLAQQAADIIEHKQAEQVLRESQERQAFFLKLSDAVRTLADPLEIEETGCRLLAEHLDVDRAYYVEVDEDRRVASVRRDFVRGDAPSLAGEHRIADFGWSVEILRRGDCHVVTDTRTSEVVPPEDRPACLALQIIACAGAPLIKGGRLMGALCVTASTPRAWSAAEIDTLRDVGDRLWAAIVRARAEKALHDSEESLRRFGEASQEILWVRDAETLQWTYLTPAFEEIYGLSRQEALHGDNYRSWLDLVVPEDRAHVNAAIRKVRRGKDIRFDYRIRRPADGAVRWLRNSDFPITDAGGKVTHVGGIGHDLTELRETERRFQTLMSGIPQLVWRASDGGHWTWSSPQWTAFTGLTDKESLGLGWLDAVHPDDRAAAHAAWDAAGASGVLEMEGRFYNAPGNFYRWFQTRARPVRDENGEIMEWLGTSTDIHDLRELQDHQKILVAELQHRTRNLLAVVRALSEQTMETSADMPDFRERFGDRLAALSRVQGLLSRQGEKDRVMIGDLIRMELAALTDGLDRVSLDGPEDIRLRSSSVQIMALALHELATNAVKHGALGQPSGRLDVTWTLKPSGRDDTAWLNIDWTETGVTNPPREGSALRSGQGRELIERALPYQLDARTTFDVTQHGMHCTISMPVSAKDPETQDDG